MAFSTKLFFLFFLLTLLYSKNINAREHKFFSKIPRINSKEHTKTLEEEAKEIEKQELGPLYEEAEQNGPEFFPENENDKSQKYASLSNKVNVGDHDKTTIIPDIDRSDLPYNNIAVKVDSLDKTLVNGVHDKITTGTPDIYRAYLPYDNGDNVDLAMFNTKSYATDSEGNNGNSAKGFRSNNYGGKTIYDRNINNNDVINYDDVKALVKQGMIDTRFMENGKYYNDINSEKNGDDSYGKNARFEFKDYRRNGGFYGNNQENTQFDGYNKKNKAQFEDFKFDEGFN